MGLETRLPEWLSWLERIEKDVRRLLMDRHIFKETMTIVEANPATYNPNDFVDWFTSQYGNLATIRVRQQVDHRKDSVSLYRLLDDLRSRAQIT